MRLTATTFALLAALAIPPAVWAQAPDAPDTPETPPAETPAEAPETPPAEAPETPPAEAPETPATEAPETPAAEAPETPAAEAPETPAAETPGTPAIPPATPAIPPATTPVVPAENPALKAPADVAAVPADAEKSASGLAWKVLNAGTGTEKPGATDRVQVHYTGWQTDGKRFDSSVERGTPASFALNGVIKGWTEGVQLMVEGEKRRFWIPAELAYGNDPNSGRPTGLLVFDIELLDILKPHPVPPDVAEAPADAEKTPSGLATKVIKKGNGGTKPQPRSVVEAVFTGWTPDGEMFFSTIPRGRPEILPLPRIIKGLFEGIQLMEVGETRRMWLPSELAYGEDPPPGGPKGKVVFEVELVRIVR